jgi:carbamoyl-phosphate synthase small subunit
MSKEKKRKAILALENGSIYEGSSCGVEGEKTGWVSFYTGVVGYQEVITSPSNAGKLVLMTYPLIGNYGVAKKFWESKRCWAEGLIIKEMSRITSNWQAEDDFDDFLKEGKVLAIEGVDTRALMVELRDEAEQWGIISTSDFSPKSLKRKIEQAKSVEPDFIKRISNKGIVELSDDGKTVGIIDIGLTNSLLNQLTQLGCKPALIPYQTPAEDILALSPKGVIISDGPEMDKGSYVVVDTVKQLLGRLPIFGLGAGCQILSLAMGLEIKRMHLGHHGVNYPILKPGSLKGEITQQNHSYAIDEDSLKGKDVEVSWRNLNDNTIEGIENEVLKAFGCQFYPASPGLDEVNPILEDFVGSLD